VETVTYFKQQKESGELVHDVAKLQECTADVFDAGFRSVSFTGKFNIVVNLELCHFS
jgi:hypothetical protein